MRINQAYISQSVADFPFLERLSLAPYVDSTQPALFIGCYSEDDLAAILQHQGKAVVLWCGQDSLDCILRGWHARLKHVKHVTWLTNVERALRNFLPVSLVSPILLGGNFQPSVFGKRIYAYCPASFPQYHRADLIAELQDYYQDHFEFVIGGGGIAQSVWLSSFGNVVYNDCFIGLCLSGFAGGGQTILQMGLKGRRVVTNVMNAPNTYEWGSVADIKKAIEAEAKLIGKEGNGMAKLVKAYVDKEPTWLEV
jgi:hypothetical protein